MQQVSGGLPAEYRQIDWIRQGGGPWLDTGVVPTEQTVAKFKFKNTTPTGNAIFGYYDTERTSWRFFNYNENSYFDLPSGDTYYRLAPSSGQFSFKIYRDTVYEVELGNQYIIVDGERKGRDTSRTFPTTPTKSLTLGMYSATSTSDNTWYWVKIYEGQTLIRDMIPCVRIADSKPGMYDLVGRQFYVNQGTSEFVIPT